MRAPGSSGGSPRCETSPARSAEETGGHRSQLRSARHRALRKQYEAALAHAQTLAAQAIRSGDARVAAASSRSIVVLLSYLLASLVIGLGVAYWLVRTVANPVARLVAILGPAR